MGFTCLSAFDPYLIPHGHIFCHFCSLPAEKLGSLQLLSPCAHPILLLLSLTPRAIKESWQLELLPGMALGVWVVWAAVCISVPSALEPVCEMARG